jgi:hypothetical protein
MTQHRNHAPPSLHSLARTAADAGDFLSSHTEPGITILNAERYYDELLSFAGTAAKAARKMERVLVTLKGGAA